MLLGTGGEEGPSQEWALVTPLRDPVTHYLAWFYYYAEPDHHPSLEQWVRAGRGGNGAASLPIPLRPPALTPLRQARRQSSGCAVRRRWRRS